jgi:hypothetical protein
MTQYEHPLLDANAKDPWWPAFRTAVTLSLKPSRTVAATAVRLPRSLSRACWCRPGRAEDALGGGHLPDPCRSRSNLRMTLIARVVRTAVTVLSKNLNVPSAELPSA